MIDLTPSQNEYLKAIYVVSKTGKVTITKIADYLNYSKPSVVNALKGLESNQMILYTKETIKLTDLGLKYVNNLLRRDEILQKFLIEVLQVDEDLALKDAHRMKHAVSCCTVKKLESFLTNTFGYQMKNDTNYCIKDEIHNCKSCTK